MSLPRVEEKEKRARRCLAEIAIFDSVDLKTLKPEELQRFLYLAQEYSAYSTDPDLEKSFSKLEAIYNISPNLTQKIDEVIHHKLKNNPEDAMEYFEMLKRQEMEAMMQAKYEQYMTSLKTFKHSVEKVYSTAERFDASVASIGKKIFNVGATKDEIKETLASIYATNPVLAQAIIAEHFKGKNIPKEYAGFFYTPQELASTIGKKTVDSKTCAAFKKIYASNPVATVQAIKEAYTKKGLPIPAELVPFSKLPDGFNLSTGNIVNGPIRVSSGALNQATVLQHQLVMEYKDAIAAAKKTDAAANAAKLSPEKQRENVLANTPAKGCTGGAACVIDRVEKQIPQGGKGPAERAAREFGYKGRETFEAMRRNIGLDIGSGQGVDSDTLDDAYNGEGNSSSNNGAKNIDPSQTSVNAEDYGLNYDDLAVLPVNQVVSTDQDTTGSRHHIVQTSDSFGAGMPDLSSEVTHSDPFKISTPMSADSREGSLDSSEMALTDMGDILAADLEAFGDGGDDFEVPELADASQDTEEPSKINVEFGLPPDGVMVYTNASDTGLAYQDIRSDFSLEEEAETNADNTPKIEVSSVLKDAALVVDDVSTSLHVDDVLRDSQQQTVPTKGYDKERVG
ncbi:MAG: hypothetical protein IJY92_04630 [Alphaproteobacteria bacterium]|nr:hypothetical protein [Alphaproteobacteria bacterium]